MNLNIPTALFVALLMSACSQPQSPATQAAATAPQVAAPALTFINKVWQAPGMFYVFMSDGTLVMTSPTATPAFGRWTQENGQLTMIEEGISYPTDVLELTANTFKIRSHNPGEPVEIAMTLAP
jgi:hypothetical protein